MIAVGPSGVARLDRAGNWLSIPLSGLPSGIWTGAPARAITHVAVGPYDTEWLAGSVTSHFDDAAAPWGTQSQGWIAFHCPVCGEWHAFTSEEIPELAEEIGDIVVSADGVVYASVGENLLLAYDGDRWEAHVLPLPGSYSVSPWSSSMAVGKDGVVWAATDFIGGVIAFDGDGFTRYTTEDGLPTDAVRRVAWGPGVYTAFMIVDARPLTAEALEELSGRLIWNETAVDLCGISLRLDGTDYLHVGDIFQTSEGCGEHPAAMQEAFGEFGLPELGCVTVRSTFGEHEFCAPLPVVEAEPLWPQPGWVTVSLDRLEGLRGLVLEARLLPSEPTLEGSPMGGVHFGVIQEDPYSGSDAIQPRIDGYFDGVTDATAGLPSGTYRFIIEAYAPSGPMRYGCEQQIEVIEDEWTVVVITRLPPYAGDSWHWTSYDQLDYPDCRG